MSEPASISTGIAGRYASAVFELSKDSGALAALESDVDALDTALGQSPELRDAISSPIFSREDQLKAIDALAKKMGLSELTTNTLGLMAGKRRLFVLPQMIAALQDMIAADKGEITAEVATAAPLSADQSAKLVQALTARTGKSVKLKTTVDETLIGGLVVKLGSTMIDTSIRAKLSALQNAMKEVG